ncbi:MAG TPA: OmpA family protein [Bacteroidota bacterium]|jgi:outer membrane protein OmpA-like peptidoglycan-associated protein
MKKHSLLALVPIMFALLSVILVPVDSGFAQNTAGRWVLGFHGGGNMWINDYSDVLVGPGGDFMLRYGITPAFSAGILAGYEELKSEQKSANTGQVSDYLKLNAIPASANVWVHFASGSVANPYVYGGIGVLLFKRLDGAGNYVPDSKFIPSVLVPFGVGLEIFPSNNASIVLDGGYRVTDDYPDDLKRGNLDGYATAKLGVNLYIGTGYEDEEAQHLRDAEERHAKQLAEVEELRLKQQADADAQAKRLKDSADAEIQRVKKQTDADAEARRVKELADAEARRVKELADAEARRLAEQKQRDTTIIVLEKGKTVVLKGVNFEFNKATLTVDSKIILTRALNALNASPELNVLIVGHTDNIGSAAYNKQLSFRRAEAVRSWLVGNGISGKRLTVSGKGYDEPIDDNTTDEGRANNRRIEFHVLE